MTQTANPLKQFFRQPAIYLSLPSAGNFWPKEAIRLPDNKELPVLPMTAIDEITYRTPDALFNGTAVVNVIQSCVPNIVDAWAAPGTDINSILVAIRIASYGHNMEIDSTCPSCNTEGEYGVDLRTVLENLTSLNYDLPIQQGDLTFTFRPMTYREQNQTNQAQFDQQRLIQSISQSDLPDEEKIIKLNHAIQEITKLTISALKWSIASISAPGTLVTDHEHVAEFLSNCDRGLFVKIRDHITTLRSTSEFKPLNMKCSSCEYEYTQTLTLDQTSFFEAAS
jgi:hypothetical protein